MRGAVVVLCIGLLLALAGCSSRENEPVAGPCTGEDFTLEGLSVQGAGGSLLGHVTFARKPGRPCKLYPMARARILWADGTLAIPVPLVDHLPGDSTAQARAAAERAAMGFTWRNWCGVGLWGWSLPGPLRLSVSFGYGGDPFEVRLKDRPRCDSRSSPSRAVSTRLLAA